LFLDTTIFGHPRDLIRVPRKPVVCRAQTNPMSVGGGGDIQRHTETRETGEGIRGVAMARPPVARRATPGGRAAVAAVPPATTAWLGAGWVLITLAVGTGMAPQCDAHPTLVSASLCGDAAHPTVGMAHNRYCPPHHRAAHFGPSILECSGSPL
jgi:hypothetical protein